MWRGHLTCPGRQVVKVRLGAATDATADEPEAELLLHYLNWSKRWDEWVPACRVLEKNAENLARKARLTRAFREMSTFYKQRRRLATPQGGRGCQSKGTGHGDAQGNGGASSDPDSTAEACGICMDTVQERGLLDCCRHWFCFDCVDEWSQVTNTCPLCKFRFRVIAKYPMRAPDGSSQDPQDVPKGLVVANRDQPHIWYDDAPAEYFPDFFIDENDVDCLPDPACLVRASALRMLEEEGEEEEPPDGSYSSVECDVCKRWYHTVCVGFDVEPGASVEEEWACPLCQNVPPGTGSSSPSILDTLPAARIGAAPAMGVNPMKDMFAGVGGATSADRDVATRDATRFGSSTAIDRSETVSAGACVGAGSGAGIGAGVGDVAVGSRAGGVVGADASGMNRGRANSSSTSTNPRANSSAVRPNNLGAAATSPQTAAAVLIPETASPWRGKLAVQELADNQGKGKRGQVISTKAAATTPANVAANTVAAANAAASKAAVVAATVTAAGKTAGAFPQRGEGGRLGSSCATREQQVFALGRREPARRGTYGSAQGERRREEVALDKDVGEHKGGEARSNGDAGKDIWGAAGGRLSVNTSAERNFGKGIGVTVTDASWNTRAGKGVGTNISDARSHSAFLLSRSDDEGGGDTLDRAGSDNNFRKPLLVTEPAGSQKAPTGAGSPSVVFQTFVAAGFAQNFAVDSQHSGAQQASVKEPLCGRQPGGIMAQKAAAKAAGPWAALQASAAAVKPCSGPQLGGVMAQKAVAAACPAARKDVNIAGIASNKLPVNAKGGNSSLGGKCSTNGGSSLGGKGASAFCDPSLTGKGASAQSATTGEPLAQLIMSIESRGPTIGPGKHIPQGPVAPRAGAPSSAPASSARPRAPTNPQGGPGPSGEHSMHAGRQQRSPYASSAETLLAGVAAAKASSARFRAAVGTATASTTAAASGAVNAGLTGPLLGGGLPSGSVGQPRMSGGGVAVGPDDRRTGGADGGRVAGARTGQGLEDAGASAGPSRGRGVDDADAALKRVVAAYVHAAQATPRSVQLLARDFNAGIGHARFQGGGALATACDDDGGGGGDGVGGSAAAGGARHHKGGHPGGSSDHGNFAKMFPLLSAVEPGMRPVVTGALHASSKIPRAMRQCLCKTIRAQHHRTSATNRHAFIVLGCSTRCTCLHVEPSIHAPRNDP
eukprot:jgi/Mesvir1/2085/Mv16618-RA.1